jgi:plastocyanin domain-containing protein
MLRAALLSLALASLPITAGCTKPASASAQLVAVSADQNGFTPNAVDVQRGTALTLRFTRTTDKTCADRVVFPDLGIDKPLPVGQPVDITVPTAEPKRFTFQCGMGMFKSAVVVR